MRNFPAILPLLLAVLPLPARAQDAPSPPPQPTQAELNAQLGRGINLGDFLECKKEGDSGAILKESYFSEIEKAGFRTVRLPVAWSAHAGMEAPYPIDPEFLARVDWAVTQAKEHHLNLILDLHNYSELYKTPDAEAARFVGLWKELAEHYAGEPPTVLFELCNEPNGALDAPHWNALLLRALAAVRPSNPDRLILIGPVQWNGIRALPSLLLPSVDRRIVATVHDYDPMPFTHQGASWVEGSAAWLGNRWEGTEKDKQPVEASLDTLLAWSQAQDRPVFLGEFGAFEKAPLADRVQWTAFMTRSLEKRGIPWAYWEFCFGFGAFDPKAEQWRPELLQALIPPPSP